MHKCILQFCSKNNLTAYSAVIQNRNRKLWSGQDVIFFPEILWSQAFVFSSLLDKVKALGIKKILVEVNSKPLMDAVYGNLPESTFIHATKYHLNQARKKLQELQEVSFSYQEYPEMIVRAENCLIAHLFRVNSSWVKLMHQYEEDLIAALGALYHQTTGIDTSRDNAGVPYALVLEKNGEIYLESGECYGDSTDRLIIGWRNFDNTPYLEALKGTMPDYEDYIKWAETEKRPLVSETLYLYTPDRAREIHIKIIQTVRKDALQYAESTYNAKINQLTAFAKV